MQSSKVLQSQGAKKQRVTISDPLGLFRSPLSNLDFITYQDRHGHITQLSLIQGDKRKKYECTIWCRKAIFSAEILMHF